MWHFYVVRCSDNSLYAGVTTNVERRVGQHNHGNRGSKYTRSRRPVKLVYLYSFKTKAYALKREYWFKGLTKQTKESFIKKNPEDDVEVIWRKKQEI